MMNKHELEKRRDNYKNLDIGDLWNLIDDYDLYLDELTADLDYWKSRAEALEETISKLTTKYNIGQELYSIRSEHIYEECPHCGNIDFNKEYGEHWKIWTCAKIDAVIVTESRIYYGISDKAAQIPESLIGESLFTTRESAQAECDRKNSETKGDF